MDCSPPGSSVHGILQARILEWVAMPSSRGSSQPRDQTQVSHIVGRFFIVWATGEAHEYWIGYPFSRGSSWPRNGTGVSCLAIIFFTSWATREAPRLPHYSHFPRVSNSDSSDLNNFTFGEKVWFSFKDFCIINVWSRVCPAITELATYYCFLRS